MGAVRPLLHREVVALHDARGAAALRGADHVDALARREDVDLHLAADLVAWRPPRRRPGTRPDSAAARPSPSRSGRASAFVMRLRAPLAEAELERACSRPSPTVFFWTTAFGPASSTVTGISLAVLRRRSGSCRACGRGARSPRPILPEAPESRRGWERSRRARNHRRGPRPCRASPTGDPDPRRRDRPRGDRGRRPGPRGRRGRGSTGTGSRPGAR